MNAAFWASSYHPERYLSGLMLSDQMPLIWFPGLEVQDLPASSLQHQEGEYADCLLAEATSDSSIAEQMERITPGVESLTGAFPELGLITTLGAIGGP